MTTTIITANTINVGTGFSFAAAGDTLVVLPNVTLGSITGAAISFGFADTDVTIMGNLVSVSMLLMQQDSGFTVTSTGSFVSVNPSSGSAAIDLAQANGSIQIDGTLTAQDSIGILAAGVGSRVTITGSVSGGSAGVFMGLFGSPDNQLVNSGTISAGSVGDMANDTRFNNGVLAEGFNNQITNLAGGTITATSSQGAGVRLAAGGDGTVVSNAGTITALTWYGVDFDTMGVSETARLFNSGVIQGLAGAFRGNDSADNVTNRGAMIGQVDMGLGDDRLDGRGGRFDGLVLGGDGNDSLDFRGTGLALDTIFGGIGLDTVLGTDGTDTIDGGDDDDNLSGRGGDDVILGGLGVDTLLGGDGNDLLAGDDGLGVLFGGQGDDHLTVLPATLSAVMQGHGGAGDDTLDGGLADDVMFGGAGDDEVFGGDGIDAAQGGAGDDMLDLGTGVDLASGGVGDDTILGGDGTDSVMGDAGADLILGGNDNDTMGGGEGSDTLQGDVGRDLLLGGGGDDVLIGGASGDVMTGGLGSDIFLFTSVFHIGTAAGNRDKITDFTAGSDLLDLTVIDANTAVAGDQAFAYIGAAAFGNVAGQLRYSTVDGLLQGDINGDGVADFSLFLASLPVIGAANILL